MSITRRFTVEGMSCGGCERSLSLAGWRLQGGSAGKPSHAARSASVIYDEQAVTPEAITAAIRDAGYEPTGF